MQCDICGKEANLFRVKIEGSMLNVCNGCSPFGEVIGRVVEQAPQKVAPKETVHKEGPIELIVTGFGSIIKNRREQMGLKQVDFAKKINEKDSLIHKIETGTITPPIELARKIERFLGVKLIEVFSDDQTKQATKHNKDEELTLGDALKLIK